MTDKVQKIKDWISKEKDGLMDAQGNFGYPEHEGAYHILCNLDTYINSLREEPVEELEKIVEEITEPTILNAYGTKELARRLRNTVIYGTSVSKELDEVAELYTLDDSIKPWRNLTKEAFKAGAKWQKSNLWKPANGDDLPIFDREVVVLVKYSTQRNIHDKEYSTYRVGFAHRPNPEGYDGKSIATGKIEHYIPKTYGKGGWNIPDVIFWLDVDIPKLKEG